MPKVVASDKILTELVTVKVVYKMADKVSRLHALSGFWCEGEGKLYMLITPEDIMPEFQTTEIEQ